MFYYQIFKKRRLDLNLSVQDIAIQTHLAPEFIRAIEDNNLDMFAQDLSYVRYFVHAYADVLGVNWQAIQAEVDGNVEVYARARDQALTQAQRIMAAQMQAAAAEKNRQSRSRSRNKTKTSHKKASASAGRSHSTAKPKSASKPKAEPQTRAKAKPKKRKKRRISFFKSSANAVSRMLNWNGQDMLSKVAVIGTICVFLILVAFNYAVESYNAKSVQAMKEERQQELMEKEQETQKLADQLATQKQADAQANGTAPIVTESTKKTNTFYVTNVLGVSSEINISAKADSPFTIIVKEGDKELFNSQVDDVFSKNIEVDAESTFTIQVANYTSADTIEISGTPLSLNASGFTNGSGKITVEVLYYVPDETTKDNTTQDKENNNSESDASSSTSEEDSSNAADTQAADTPAYDIYGNPIVSDQNQSQSTTPQYDAYGNLIQDQSTTPQYDAYGNLIQDQSTTPQYDAYGNLIQDQSTSDPYGTSGYGTQSDPYGTQSTTDPYGTGLSDSGIYDGGGYNYGYQ